MDRLTHPSQVNEWNTRVLAGRPSYAKTVVISSGTCGQASGSLGIIEAFTDEIAKRGLKDLISVKVTGCHGCCELEPNIIVYPDGLFYQKLEPRHVPGIIDLTLLEDRIIPALVPVDVLNGIKYPFQKDIPFYRKQLRWLTESNFRIDPTSIEDYVAQDGYKALAKVLGGMTAEDVIADVKASGLRGRGGAGFLTGAKWALCRASVSEYKHIICNADEGDPGAYMDRSLLEGNPHSVIEGMIIGAYAIGGTSQGFIYVRKEYPLAVKHLGTALDAAREAGLLGGDILGTGFSFDIRIVQGAGAFVSGEETSLMASIEGRRAFPRQRPPYPTEQGLWGRPTNINNVETWANIPLIIHRGWHWFAGTGTEKSKGTKIFSLVGKINNTGLVEVPMGISLREIVFDIGGGIKDGKRFKAVQTGGPSGGCIPAEMMDLPIDYDTLARAGSIVGSGGMIVMDEDTCMVDVARFFLRFTQEESCGKCVPCRVGTRQMEEILTRITEGKGEQGDIERLEDLANTVKQGSLCGLGQTAPNPVLTTLRYFRSEYEAHIQAKNCPAHVCKNLIAYVIEPDKCVGCLLCLKNCPVGAIRGEFKKIHTVDQALCIKCGACFEVCPRKIRAVARVSAREAEKR
jgi:NADH:ubiquinone oxidoreductase subunit F (NADH-binding)/(2Fe-2S) ferredoxin